MAGVGGRRHAVLLRIQRDRLSGIGPGNRDQYLAVGLPLSWRGIPTRVGRDRFGITSRTIDQSMPCRVKTYYLPNKPAPT